MSLLEAYLFLFFDSAMSCLVLVPNTTMVYNLMLVFGGYNKFCMILIGIIGSAAGASLNYLLGVALRSIKQRVESFKDSQRLIALSNFANRRLVGLLLFSFVPVSGVIATTAAGFLRISYTRFVLVFLVGRLGYYLYLLQYT